MVGNSSEPSFHIDQAFTSHVDMIAPVFDRYRMFYGQDSDIELARSFLFARIKSQDSVLFMALETDGIDDTLLGFTMLYPSYDSVSASPLWILNDLFVEEKARKKGIARALVNRGKRLVEETSAKIMSLDTATNNVASHRLYESLGFHRDDTFCTYILNVE